MQLPGKPPSLGSQTQTCPLPVGCQKGSRAAAGLQWVGREGSGGMQQATAGLSRLPAEPVCGCAVPRCQPTCGSRVVHEKQPSALAPWPPAVPAGPTRCATSHTQHSAVWPEDGLSPPRAALGL